MSVATALDALLIARRAWERSQPQTFMDFGELEARQTSTLLCLEPVTAAHSPEVRGGLAPGAEPCRDKAPGLTDLRAHRPEDSPVAVPPARSGGSAPLQTTTEADANLSQRSRVRLQKGA